MKKLRNLFLFSILLEIVAIGLSAHNYNGTSDLITIVSSGILIFCGIAGIWITKRYEATEKLAATS